MCERSGGDRIYSLSVEDRQQNVNYSTDRQYTVVEKSLNTEINLKDVVEKSLYITVLYAYLQKVGIVDERLAIMREYQHLWKIIFSKKVLQFFLIVYCMIDTSRNLEQ